ncbi:UDP-glycosyltransferase 91A1-like isoform X2 [Diospyros lotus]|uniref:UDP-glycosyltransferase 91A1-like isoform X2 n=1 Tax=Diospyros lotus TaxID=55363 RepID=UPI002251D35E|nr:UDP-glycosyltransferase 91A1-like isoform X2 [Diospyros lotus]
MASTDDKLHVVMLPWLAFGHFLPFLELSKLIARKGHRISFLSTPRNIDRLPKPPAELSHLITFVKLPLPPVENLPEDAEATTDLPYGKIKYLKKAYDELQRPVAAFLQDAAPDWVIFDFAPFWLGPIAAKLGISSAFFSIYLASSVCFMNPIPGTAEDCRTTPEDFTVPPKSAPFKSTVAFRLFEVKRIFDDVSGEDDLVPVRYRVGAGIEGCDLVVLRSCYEFESEWITFLGQIHSKPVIPVGLLPPPVPMGDDGKDKGWQTIKHWLDTKPPGSVVYVAFGTEAKLSQPELAELALGLELSELPFFWVLNSQGGSVSELPEGFEERTKGRGVVWRSWAPQLKILSHDSVGGFLCHSGWSSVVEAVQLGKPLVLLTGLSDSGLVARVLEEKKMAYSVPRDERDGWFTRDSVADSLRLVMVAEGGQIFKDKVREMKGQFGDRVLQDQYVDNLLAHFKAHTSRASGSGRSTLHINEKTKKNPT